MADKACERCGQSVYRFGRGGTGAGRPPKFCSAKCKTDAGNARKKSLVYVTQKCLVCGAGFDTTTTGGRATCSAECAAKRGVVECSTRRTDRRMAARRERGPCKQCGQPIPDTVRVHAVYCSTECQQEAAHVLRNETGSLRDYMMTYLYGITREEFGAKLEEQSGGCAICGTTEWPGKGNSPHVDHDHDTGVFRGILCHHCNIGLGNFGDSIPLLEAAIAYLRRYA